MPVIKAPLKPLPLEGTVAAVGYSTFVTTVWLVAREAGVTPEAPLLSANEFDRMTARWGNARRLPAAIKCHQPLARLFYRMRALTLQLHGHPWAQCAGGPEQWWQQILREQLLADMTAALAPQVLDNEVQPVSPTIMRWWMRRGVNPVPPETQPATWALIEAIQSLVFSGRDEATAPPLQPVVSLQALNGDWSLTKRKTVCEQITGRLEGYTKRAALEIYRDWNDLLIAWQSTAKGSAPKKLKPKRMQIDYDATFELVCKLLNEVYFPAWAAVNSDIYDLIRHKRIEKPSDCNGFDAVEKIETNPPLNRVSGHVYESDWIHATKQGKGKRQPPFNPAVAEHTSTQPCAALRYPTKRSEA